MYGRLSVGYSQPGREKMDKRRYQRMEISNLVVDVSDGNHFFPGSVSDISQHGILLTDIPNKLDDQARKLSIVVSGNGKNFKMQATPRWTSEQGANKKIGVELVDIPFDWTQFVNELEPRPIDAWGYMSL
jgi:hypothetical protein